MSLVKAQGIAQDLPAIVGLLIGMQLGLSNPLNGDVFAVDEQVILTPDQVSQCYEQVRNGFDGEGAHGLELEIIERFLSKVAQHEDG
jgi:hypothetical protein